jgi:hypothetical protein
MVNAKTITGLNLVNRESVSQESSGIPASFQTDTGDANQSLIQARVPYLWTRLATIQGNTIWYQGGHHDAFYCHL